MRNQFTPFQQFTGDTIALAVLIGLALLGAWLAHSPMRSAAFDLAGDERSLRRAGFYALEYTPPPVEPFRWAAGSAAIDLPNPGGALHLTLRLQGTEQPDGATLTTHAGTFTLPLSPTSRRYSLRLPPAPGERLTLHLEAPVVADANSRRELGVQVRSASVSGGGSAPRAVGASLVGGALLLYLSLRTGGVRLPIAFTLTALAIAPPLIWQAAGGWRSGLFAPRVLTGAMAGGVAMIGWTLLQQTVHHRGVRPKHAPGEHSYSADSSLGRMLRPNRHRPPSVVDRRSSVIRRLSSFILHPASCILALYLALAVWNSVVVHPNLDPDLANYLMAGDDVLRGANPYGRFSLDLIGAGFVYTPATLPLFAVLSLLPFAEIWAIWFVGNIALYLVALLATWLSLQHRPGTGALILTAVVALGSTTFLEALAIGQINSLMLAGMALFVYGHANRRCAWLGDIALACAILIKLTPALLLLWPLVRGDWARLARVALGLALLCVPSLLAFGFTPWLQFIVLLPSLLQGPTANPYNQSLAAVLTALNPANPLWETLAGLIGRLFTLVLLGAWALRCWGMRGQSGPGPLALGVLALAVGSNLVWHHHLMFLLIPALWLYFTAAPGSPRRYVVLAALGLIQATRLVERSFDLPALTAVAGYVILFGLFVWERQGRRGLWDERRRGRAT